MSGVEAVIQKLKLLKSSLVVELHASDLIERNAMAHKWQVTFHCFAVKELCKWRIVNLLNSVILLENESRSLGARILLRSSFETLGVLIYLNGRMKSVVDGNIPFTRFCEVLLKLLFGSKLIEHNPDPINVMEAIRAGDKVYPGLLNAFNSLSESAHPNFDGMLMGFASGNEDEKRLTFHDKTDVHSPSNVKLMSLCIEIFEHEYDAAFLESMRSLEVWLVDNEENLKI
jgi:hypothetical protein